LTATNPGLDTLQILYSFYVAFYRFLLSKMHLFTISTMH